MSWQALRPTVPALLTALSVCIPARQMLAGIAGTGAFDISVNPLVGRRERTASVLRTDRAIWARSAVRPARLTP